MENNKIVSAVNKKHVSKILSSSRFEKQYLMSALSTRIFIVGLGETKSLNSAIKYFKNLDKKYNGLASPFYFDKVLKHNGKFFWNPFIPIFFGDAFEKYIVNEFEQLKEDVLVQSPGVSFLDFSTCGSKSRLNTTIDLFTTGKFKLYDNTHKIYIKWEQPQSMLYKLGRFLNACPKNCEPWLVLDGKGKDIDFEMLESKGLKGVVINLLEEENNMINTENIGYNKTPLSDLIIKIKSAGLIVGINVKILYPKDANLHFIMKNIKDLSAHFMVWNDDTTDDRHISAEEKKINKAAIERAFLKANSSKDYEHYPLVFYPEFFKRIIKVNVPMKKFASISFENGTMIENRASYTELFKEMMEVKKIGSTVRTSTIAPTGSQL